jgi:nucleoside-diphosphate-sugar epimerase
MKLFESPGHSRMPVYDETLDDPRGMVHIRDVVAAITRLARLKRNRGRDARTALPRPGHNRRGELDLGKVRARQDHRGAEARS